jgi:hypothetical protein
VDGYSSPRAKKLALQVSQVEWFVLVQGVGADEKTAVHSVNIAMHDF